MIKGAKDIQFGVFNARSICNKITAATEFLIDQKIDICFVTETWMKLNDVAVNAEIHDSGLDIHNASRKGIGGGVGFIFDPKRVKLVRNNVAKYSSFEVLEAVLNTSTDTVRLCVIYRSTQNTSRKKYLATRQAKFFEDFSDYLDCLSSKSGKPLICGDFNFHVENSLDAIANQFCRLIDEKGFRQHVSEPTHISGGTLDLILTKSTPEDVLDVQQVSVNTQTGTTSDHFLVKFNIPLFPTSTSIKKKVTKQIRELAKIDIDDFKKDIIENMPVTKDISSLSDAVLKFNFLLEKVIDSHAPLKLITVSEKESPWLDAECKTARRARRKAERLYKKNPTNPVLAQSFQEKQVDASIIINSRRNKYYTDKISNANGDPKATYKIINTLFDKQYFESKLPKGDSDQGTAEKMKNFFHEKVSTIYKEIESVQMRNEEPASYHDVEATACSQDKSLPSATYFKLLVPTEVEAIIKSMGNKSCLLDPVPTWLFKNCLNELLPIVTSIVNLSLQTGTFPNELKNAVVRPLLKKPTLDPDLLSNYRPISNLSFLSKIIEKAVHIQLTDYLEENKLFPSLQSGYRKSHSCETAVLRIHNDVLFSMDKQSHVCLMLIDLSAAFDTINHKFLLKRLANTYNINGVVLEWICSYLTGRAFNVHLNGSRSEDASLDIGVPQGSILGPLLFILYTKDLQSLAKKYNFSIHLYADDTQIYFELDQNNDNLENLKRCFIDIREWMSSNYLKMNDEKTEIMEIHSPYTPVAPNSTFRLDNCEITPTNAAKNLGFWFDDHMSLEKQINHVSRTCYQNLRKIGRIGSKLTKSLKIQLVHSFIHSMIDYCNGTYFALTRFLLQKLQKIQNASVRFILGLKGKDRFQSMTPLLKELHFLPVSFRIQFKIALLTFKCINNIAPQYLASLVSLRKTNVHSVRDDQDFYLLNELPEPRCAKTKGAFSYCAPKIWNSLPYRLRSLTNVDAFKCSLKTHLFKNAFMSEIDKENFNMNILFEYEI